MCHVRLTDSPEFPVTVFILPPCPNGVAEGLHLEALKKSPPAWAALVHRPFRDSLFSNLVYSSRYRGVQATFLSTHHMFLGLRSCAKLVCSSHHSPLHSSCREIMCWNVHNARRFISSSCHKHSAHGFCLHFLHWISRQIGLGHSPQQSGQTILPQPISSPRVH